MAISISLTELDTHAAEVMKIRSARHIQMLGKAAHWVSGLYIPIFQSVLTPGRKPLTGFNKSQFSIIRSK